MSQPRPYDFQPEPEGSYAPLPPAPSVAAPVAYASAGTSRFGSPVATGAGYGQAPGYATGPGYGQAAYAPYGYPAPPAAGTDTFAIVSLILSLVGVSLIGVVFGHLSLRRIATSGQQGRGMAVAGLVIGYIGIAFSLLYLALVAVGVFAGASGY